MLTEIVKTLIARWQIAAAIAAALVLTHGLAYCEGRSDGKEAVMAKLHKAEAKAAKESLEAAAKADQQEAAQADRDAQVIAEQIEAIEAAEKEGGNALDSIF